MPASSTYLLALAQRFAAPLYAAPPLIMERGDNAWLYDTCGKTYLDWACGMGVNLLGHGHPILRTAMHQQIDKLCHTSNALYTEAPILLAERLGALFGNGRSFLCNSGAEAIEGAIKLVRKYHHAKGRPRKKLIATTMGFHGRTLGALSITGQPKLWQGFAPDTQDVVFVPYGDIEALNAAIDTDTAAIFLEPIQGNGGVVCAPPGYLLQARQLTREAGALLVFDEIQTGMGRCGTLFAFEHDGVKPDVITLAKALGGGLPLGAVVADVEVMQALRQGDHGSTFGGNPVACAAAVATLDVVMRPDFLSRVRSVGGEIMRRFYDLIGPSGPGIKAVRGRGLLWGLVLEDHLDSTTVKKACLAQGLLVTQATARVVRLFLPACFAHTVSQQSRIDVAHDVMAMHLDAGIDKLVKAFKVATSNRTTD